MVAPDDQAHDMGNHQSDKTDHSTDRDHGADHQRGSDKDLPLEGTGLNAELHGRFFAESDEIEGKALGPQPEETENDVGPDESDGQISAGGKAAHKPEKQSLSLIEINDRIKKHNHGGDESVENHSGQQQVIRVDLVARQQLHAFQIAGAQVQVVVLAGRAG